MRKQTIVIAFVLAFIATVAHAQEAENGVTANAAALLAATYETCSMDALQRFKVTDDYQNKLPLDAILKKNATNDASVSNIKDTYNLTDIKGLAQGRLIVLGNYAFCMKDVKPEKADKVQTMFAPKAAYLSCGEDAAINFRILDDLSKGKTAEDLNAVFPQSFHEKIRAMADVVKNKSLDEAVGSASKSAETCIENQQAKAK